ncbi:MAG: AMP-binding protein [Woeseiaceae bacterium]|nr:AMP-binding protein [Woeseiaceae bacterium]
MTWFKAAEPNLPELLRLNARWRPGKAAVIDGDVTVSWREVAGRAARVAEALFGLGLAKGDRVAILMNNGLPMLDAILGATWGGFVAVPLNVSVADAGIAKMLVDCDAAAVIASDEHVARIDGMRDELPSRAKKALVAAGADGDGWHELQALVAAADAGRPVATLTPDDPCNIIYSSGTTGMPKGIVHSHGCRMAWAYDMSVALRYDSDARTLISLGLYSNITWVALLATILCGGTVVLTRGFDVSGCLRVIEEQKISHSAMVPIQFQRLLAADEFGSRNLSSLRALMCCGSPLHPDLKSEIVRRLPGDFIELYGLTEGLVTIQDPSEALDNPHSVGRPCPGQEIRIVDDNDEEVAVGQSGEILGIGRLLMSGYLNRDDANEEATWVDALGRRWLRTGDIGRVDEAGNLYIVDRKKDMIISGGQNIYPADIEAVIATHDDVDDVAVIGVRSAKWGETPLAVIVAARPGIDVDALVTWANGRLGRQQRIAGARIIDALPRNPNGKVLKRELRKQFADVAF